MKYFRKQDSAAVEETKLLPRSRGGVRQAELEEERARVKEEAWWAGIRARAAKRS